MKKTYKKLIMISSVLLLALFSSQTLQASELQLPKNMIQVNGKATIKVKPNIAFVNANVKTDNKDAKKAQEENAKVIAKIKKDIMAQFNLKEEDISTVNYNVRPSYDYVEGKQIFRHHTVEHTLEITLKNIDQLGEMIDALITSGATNLNNVRFGIQDESEAYNTALQKAIQNAQQKADAITASLGVKNATPIAITEQSESMGIREESIQFMQDSVTSSKQDTVIHQSDIEVTARVQVTLQW